jgi:hypothetical protein
LRDLGWEQQFPCGLVDAAIDGQAVSDLERLYGGFGAAAVFTIERATIQVEISDLFLDRLDRSSGTSALKNHVIAPCCVAARETGYLMRKREKG